MISVIKRDGEITDFNLTKISQAVSKAFTATQKSYNDDIINLLALRVTSDFQSKIKNDTISVEEIQDSVECVLEQAGYTDVARAYILYRKTREKIRNMKSTILDYKEIVDTYVNEEDIKSRDQSDETFSVGGLVLHNSAAITANYWLTETYDSEIAQAHRSGDIHIHDLDMLTGATAGWSLQKLIKEGLGGVPGKINSAPASHLSTLTNQMVNFLGIMQNEWAGAQSFASFDTCLAPFIKAENLGYKEVKQCIQSFVYGLNTPSRWGTQAPFSCISLDLTVPEDMKNLNAVVGGRECGFTYGECQDEMDMLNMAFIQVMTEGDANGHSFRFPLPTYAIGPDFDPDEKELNRALFELASKYGVPYFRNYRSTACDSTETRKIASRIATDSKSLLSPAGGPYGAGENTGSIGWVTINIPRIAYLAADETEYFDALSRMTEIAVRSLNIKRNLLDRLMKENFFPYTKRYLTDLHNHFSTIGVIGLNEAALNAAWVKRSLTDRRGQDFAVRTLEFLREKLESSQEVYGHLFSLGATTSEVGYRLAQIDKKRFPDICTCGKDTGLKYYTTASNLPLDAGVSLLDALTVEEGLMSLYQEGAVFNLCPGERFTDMQDAARLTLDIFDRYSVPSLCLSPTYSICPTHGYVKGQHFKCPVCGEETEVYSRINSVIRSVQSGIAGMDAEYKARVPFDIAMAQEEPEETMGFSCEGMTEITSDEENAQEKLILFVTKGNSNCDYAHSFLTGLSYDTVDAEENAELTCKYGILQAPTLVVVRGKEVIKYTNASAIKGYADSLNNR